MSPRLGCLLQVTAVRLELWSLEQRLKPRAPQVSRPAVYPTEPWLEHFEWLQPVFNECLEVGEGRIRVPTAHGLGLSLSEQGRAWTTDSADISA